MKLSTSAEQLGISYKTAWRRWKAGKLDAYQLDSGTVIVRDPPTTSTGVAIDARVSSADQRADVDRQRTRLRDYAAAHGYAITSEVVEIASGVNDQRPKLLKLLTTPGIGIILVEHRDRLTRFGFTYISTLLAQQGRRLEVINDTDTANDLVDDYVAIITSMAARIYGRRNAKHRTDHLQQCIKQCVLTADQEDADDRPDDAAG